MKVLITGITGLLGRYLVREAPGHAELHGAGRGNWPAGLSERCDLHTFDTSEVAHIATAIERVSPAVIIHAAAEGRVDVVEGHASRFQDLNVTIPAMLAAYCETREVKFVFISSNAVFGGRPEAYSDADATSPINDYGRLKTEAEVAVRTANRSALIVRPILMYGWPFPGRRLNPVVSWIHRMRQGAMVDVVDDVFTEPLAAVDCARAVWAGIRGDATGPINVSGGDKVSLFGLARATAIEFGIEPDQVRAITSSDLPNLAPRPQSTTFDLRRLRDELGVSPMGVKTGLRDMHVDEPLMNSER